MKPEVDIIALALAEDVGDGDVTSAFFSDPSRRGKARIVAREAGLLAGTEVTRETFLRVDPHRSFCQKQEEGTGFAPGDTILELEGMLASILTAERVALNFLQRLSGVATLTGRYVAAVAGTGAKILDTRKTTPGWRRLEKAAVRAGGGNNHRMGLYDMVMVKDNHLAAGAGLGELQAAITRVKSQRPGMQVELEADSLEQAQGFMTLTGVDVLLLDNMSLSALRTVVAWPRQNLLLEASGGVTLDSVRSIAETGVDRISVGALTHSVRALDFALEM